MSIKDLIDEIRTVLDSYDKDEDPTPSSPIRSEPKRVQGRLRGNILHMQYGVKGQYSKADVSVSAAEAEAIYAAGVAPGANLQFSLAGSLRKYLVPKDNSDGSLTFGTVTIKSPFWSPQTAPSRSINKEW